MPGDVSLASLGRVGFVGVGAAGAILTRALDARGATIAAIASRHPDRAEALAAALTSAPQITSPEGVVQASDTVFLAVPDDVITPLAETLPWRPERAVVHLSGARGAAALASAAARDARTAALHPLMTFTRTAAPPSADEALNRLRGCSWALEASDDALAGALTVLVAALDGRIFRLAADDRVPYHIAAVLASNYVTTLLGAAVHLWEPFDVPSGAALPALLPLLRATVANLESAGLPDALSGPIARGDLSTVAAHLAWLDDHAAHDPALADLRAAYIALARLAIPLAQAKGTLSSSAAAELRMLLDAAQR